MRLSVIIIALNQEANIGESLASVRFADEIVVVDTGTKNFALDQARGDWVFSLDTDERVSAALKTEILAIVRADGPRNGYRAPRKNYFGGHWVRHLGWY